MDRAAEGSGRGLSWGAGTLSREAEARFVEGVAYCGRFFVGQAEVQQALYRLTAILEAEDIPYAIIGAFKRSHLGRGYEEALRGERFALLPLPRYLELELASGMVAPHRG